SWIAGGRRSPPVLLKHHGTQRALQSDDRDLQLSRRQHWSGRHAAGQPPRPEPSGPVKAAPIRQVRMMTASHEERAVAWDIPEIDLRDAYLGVARAVIARLAAGQSRGDVESVIRKAIEARREVELRALEDALAVGLDLRVHAEQAVSKVVEAVFAGVAV